MVILVSFLISRGRVYNKSPLCRRLQITFRIWQVSWGRYNFWAWNSLNFIFFVTAEPDHWKLCQSFCPPVRFSVWTKPLVYCQFCLQQVSKCSRGEWLQIYQLPLQDSCISRILASLVSPVCFHSFLMPLNRSCFYFIWLFYFSWLEFWSDTNYVICIR